MPSAANAKSEKPASAEAPDNSPVRQIMTIIEHKIRNLEKRKSKLTSYRDLQKAGKDLNSDQKVAVAKYDEVAQTLEFARDLSKQVASIATATEREAKKQAKKEAWVRYAADTAKIREVLLILDCLVQMGSSEAREDFLNGSNGACKLTEHDLKVLDDLYPEVTPKHELNEEGQPGFATHTARAAEHLCAIVDGRPRDALGTTYTHIKEVITAVHQCGYFDRSAGGMAGGTEPAQEPAPEEEAPEAVSKEEGELYASTTGAPVTVAAGAGAGELLRAAPGATPAPYPLCALPPITLQEVEHAYFAQQYAAAQRPLADVIGSQNFFFLQESELDSPTGTPAPLLASPTHPAHVAPLPIPSQTFTNQHFVALRPELPPPPHFPPPPDHFPLPPHAPLAPLAAPLPPHAASPAPPAAPEPAPVPELQPQAEERKPSPTDERKEDEWRARSPEREEGGDRRAQGQGDGQRRYRRYPRPPPNGYRGRGAFAPRPDRQDRSDRDRPERADYHPREYTQGRKDDRYRQDGPRYNDRDNYQSRQKDSYRGNSDAYYGNGDAGEAGEEHAAGYKGRGARARPRPAHAPRPRPAYPRKPDAAAPAAAPPPAHPAPRDE